MTSIEELLQPPDFEIKANSFIQQIESVGKKIQEANPNTDLRVTIKKALPRLIDGYDELQKVIGDSQIAGISPEILAEDLNRRSATECVVEVYSLSDAYKPLLEFIQQALILADENYGKLDTGFSPLLATTNEENFITKVGDEAVSMFNSHLYFTFE